MLTTVFVAVCVDSTTTCVQVSNKHQFINGFKLAFGTQYIGMQIWNLQGVSAPSDPTTKFSEFTSFEKIVFLEGIW